ncbi:hypothetical protein KUV80_09805 [Fictibacillus nanhaiensis]|uniref:hypothetical protein n=1 Tax=Fictibacillus nanhaiensis TaxID=742169 RepID=UPI001C96590F|nr:hypothetical protein [Fictibacillus nanhaiensis]MBY6036950.1 hypothetical protein [Fictibacillus nanhaiensis]
MLAGVEVFRMENIIRTALGQFLFLEEEKGFATPIIKKDIWITRLTYLKRDIGIEIELDLRDFDILVLLVKVNNGKLIKGYYVSNEGEKIRIHIEEIVGTNIKNQVKIKTKNDFQKQLSYQANLLYENFHDIESKGKRIFMD